MEKITLKEIFRKIIILAVIVILAASVITGCRLNRDVSEANLRETATETQQAGSNGSSKVEVTVDNTSAGNEKEISGGSESSSQTNDSSENVIASNSSNGSEATTDQNSVLFTFVISGDNRPANNENPQTEVFIKLLKYMKQQNPAFYVNVGDIIMGATYNENVLKRQFFDYLDALKNLAVLNFVAPGNHDVANKMSEKYFLEMINQTAFNNAALAKIEINALFPGEKISGNNMQEATTTTVHIESDSIKNSLYYYFEYEGTYFVIINTYEKGYWGLVKADQLFWLEQLLEKLKDKPVFVFLHPPLYSVINPDCITDNSLHIAFSSKENQDYIRALFARYKVDGVFCGHEHLYNKQEHDGVTYIITGCSGASPYAPEDEGGFNHFLRMQVKAKSWIMDVIDSSGNKVYTDEILFN